PPGARPAARSIPFFVRRVQGCTTKRTTEAGGDAVPDVLVRGLRAGAVPAVLAAALATLAHGLAPSLQHRLPHPLRPPRRGAAHRRADGPGLPRRPEPLPGPVPGRHRPVGAVPCLLQVHPLPGDRTAGPPVAGPRALLARTLARLAFAGAAPGDQLLHL